MRNESVVELVRDEVTLPFWEYAKSVPQYLSDELRGDLASLGEDIEDVL